jgi:hypothetical protein
LEQRLGQLSSYILEKAAKGETNEEDPDEEGTNVAEMVRFRWELALLADDIVRIFS